MVFLFSNFTPKKPDFDSS